MEDYFKIQVLNSKTKKYETKMVHISKCKPHPISQNGKLNGEVAFTYRYNTHAHDITSYIWDWD